MKKNSQEWISGNSFVCIKEHFRLGILLVFLWGKTSFCSAQGDFFFNLYGGSTNLWSSVYLQLPTILINGIVSTALEDYNNLNGTLRFDILKLKNDEGKIKLDNGSYWGFKAKDMFRNFQYGFKFGWQPRLSPFGVYISCAYQHRQFEALLNPDGEEWSKFRLNYIRPGIGIRVTPFINLLEKSGWSPILEIGTAYNYNFKCKAPYENEKKQFNNGMTTSFALGARFETLSFTFGAELDNYNLFNQDFTIDNGSSYPYKDIKSTHLTLYLSVAQDF